MSSCHREPVATDHRPWALPSGPWNWAQSWDKLLFAHWRVPAAELRPLIPRELRLDLFQGEAWIGVVPFQLTLRHRLLPPLPTATCFPEINVRTYVTDGPFTDGSKPGVWFFSLDASSRLAVYGARRLFNLPYHFAQINASSTPGGIEFCAARVGRGAEFTAAYCADGEPFTASPGTLEHFLTERYCLYAPGPRGVRRAEVHHGPWPLQRAWGAIRRNTMAAPLKIGLRGDPLLHYSERIQATVWPLQNVSSDQRELSGGTRSVQEGEHAPSGPWIAPGREMRT